MSQEKSMDKWEKHLQGFRESLKASGYKRRTISSYIKGAREYIETGRELEDEQVINYWKGQYNSGAIKVSSYSMHRTGTLSFVRYMQGKPVKWNGTRTKFIGCDEDCFNCPYSDCFRPDNMIHESVIDGRVSDSYLA